MKLATTLTIPVLRGPAATAKWLAAIDLLSEGRLMVGVGPGSSARDYELVGMNFEERWHRLDEAVSAHVLREEGDGYAFTHPLIAETLYRALSTNRRRRLHARVAEALEALYGTDLEAEQLAELAHQFFNAIPSAPVEKAIEYARRAGNRALAGGVLGAAAARFLAIRSPVAGLQRWMGRTR